MEHISKICLLKTETPYVSTDRIYIYIFAIYSYIYTREELIILTHILRKFFNYFLCFILKTVHFHEKWL